MLYNSLLKLDFTSHSKIIAFGDEAEAENYMNLELRKISDWAHNNKLKFNEHKSKVILMSRRKRKVEKKIEIYLNNKILEQVSSTKYLGIIFDSKITFQDHVN